MTASQARTKSRLFQAVLLALLSALIISLVPMPPTASAESPHQAPYIDEQTLFEQNSQGYACFRIPAIVESAEGTLLAFAEARRNNCGDAGNIDLVVRRSTDGGSTWGPLILVGDNGDNTFGNPVPIVDLETGRIVLVTTHNLGNDGSSRTVHRQFSTDDGRSWTPAEEITAQVKDPSWDVWYATGPMHGIQLTRGEDAGRLVLGASHEWHEDGVPMVGAHLLYSDDGGETWQIGANDERAFQAPDNNLKPQEVSVIELNDGRIYAAARDQYGTAEGNRAFAVSSDGGATFDAPFVSIPTLQTPVVQASTLRLRSMDAGDEYNRILFSAPAHPTAREVMSIRSSFDEAATWQTWQEGKVFHWGPSGYSDMVKINEQRAGLLYERGSYSPYESIVFARFNEAYLAEPNGTPPGFPEPPASGPVTADLSRYENTAYVRGDAEFTEGRFGGALALDGNDYVQMPLSESLDLGADDFTFSTWFKYDAAGGNHTIFWAYDLGPANTPQLWMRAEPGSDRIRAHMGAGLGQVTIMSKDAYNDGQWHHIALQREGASFRMLVDGEEVAAEGAPLGSVTAGGDQFGIEGVDVGQRIDGRARFVGTLDETRLYRKALSAGQIDALIRNVPISDHLMLRLPMDGIAAE